MLRVGTNSKVHPVLNLVPRALRQDFTIEALLSRLWKARRTMAVANSDASSILGGWSFRKDNLSRSLSHFVSLWNGDPTSIDRRNPRLSGR